MTNRNKQRKEKLSQDISLNFGLEVTMELPSPQESVLKDMLSGSFVPVCELLLAIDFMMIMIERNAVNQGKKL